MAWAKYSQIDLLVSQLHLDVCEGVEDTREQLRTIRIELARGIRRVSKTLQLAGLQV